MSTCDKIYGNAFLARPDKDHDVKVVFKATQVNLLNVLKIDKQQFVTQFDLAAEIKMPNVL